MRAPAILRGLEYTFWCSGALLCGLCAGAYLEMRTYQARENRRLEEALRDRSPRVLPARPRRSPPRAAGSLVGRLDIPRLRLSAIVLEGSDTRTLRLGVGRVPETADPGQAGNLVLSGHRDTFFRPLRQIRPGDRITLVTPGGGPYRYLVEWTAVVEPWDNESLKATPTPALTLVTCYPFYFVGPAPKRFIVSAHRIP